MSPDNTCLVDYETTIVENLPSLIGSTELNKERLASVNRLQCSRIVANPDNYSPGSCSPGQLLTRQLPTRIIAHPDSSVAEFSDMNIYLHYLLPKVK